MALRLPRIGTSQIAALAIILLANWMVSPENPLVARVAVNRWWQQFFGFGITKTVDDFGVQGERPVHPDLLDWLAVEFRESGWNIKAYHRMIVTSSTYRQSSKVTPEMLERDRILEERQRLSPRLFESLDGDRREFDSVGQVGVRPRIDHRIIQPARRPHDRDRPVSQ